MEINEKTNEPKMGSEKPRIQLRFVCPACGSRDLLITQFCARYPTSLLDYVEVDRECLEDSEIFDKEPYDYYVSHHNDGLEFRCDKCGRSPMIEIQGRERPVYGAEELAEWLMENCPQPTEDVPGTEEEPKTT